MGEVAFWLFLTVVMILLFIEGNPEMVEMILKGVCS